MQPVIAKDMKIGEHYLTSSNVEFEITRITNSNVYYVCPKTHEGKPVTLPRSEWKEGSLKIDETLMATKLNTSKGGDTMSETKTEEKPKVEKPKAEKKEKGPKKPSKRGICIAAFKRGVTNRDTIFAELKKAFPDEKEEKLKAQISVHHSWYEKNKGK